MAFEKSNEIDNIHVKHHPIHIVFQIIAELQPISLTKKIHKNNNCYFENDSMRNTVAWDVGCC